VSWDRGTVEFLINLAISLIGIAVTVALGWDQVIAWVRRLRRSRSVELSASGGRAVASGGSVHVFASDQVRISDSASVRIV
jgi:hypothetical protein